MSPPEAVGTLAEIDREVLECLLCRLWESRLLAVPGQGDAQARLMLIGEAPGAAEDCTGRPFMGMAGKYLDACLGEVGLSRERLFITSVIKCRPPGNRTPRADELRTCSRYWKRQLAAIGPGHVLLLGRVATKTVLELDFSEARGRLVTREGITFLPTYHPAAARRFPGRTGEAFRSHLRKVAGLLFR